MLGGQLRNLACAQPSDTIVARHLLVTNDFPPKVGGIQNYLWELWRRLPPESFAVYTTPYEAMASFDAREPYQVERSPEPVIGPYPWLVKRLNRILDQQHMDLALLDPALPLGAIGPYLNRPYGVVIHGAEVTVPGRLPLSSQLLARTLRGASLVVAAGNYALGEAERCANKKLPSVVVPPGVDHHRFRPIGDERRQAVRQSLGIGEHDFLVATVNRLVPRKGMDTLIRAIAELKGATARPVTALIGGQGRHHKHLEKLIRQTRAPVRLLGRLSDDEVVELYGAADAMAMLCRDRWFGLEQEGFGIAFLEAAAAGIPQIAGRSGGAHEAVEHGVTGIVLDRPTDVADVAGALGELVSDPDGAKTMGRAARSRAIAEFDYDVLACRLHDALNQLDI